MPSSCVRFEQQDFPGEEEERLKDGHMTIVASLARQGNEEAGCEYGDFGA
jgi:hypothetical protein